MPINFAEEISIPELFEVSKESTSIKNYSKEIYFYVNSKLVASFNDNFEYKYQNRLGSDIESKVLPFGEPILTNNRFSFTGKELDQDLYYFGARYYNPEIGRFNSVDPIKENHPYVYVNNNPLNLVDPEGMNENDLKQNYEINMEVLDEGINTLNPKLFNEKFKQKYKDLILEAIAKGVRDVEKSIISDLDEQKLESLGYVKGIPEINFIIVPTLIPNGGNYAHAYVGRGEPTEEGIETYTVRITMDFLFMNRDDFSKRDNIRIKKDNRLRSVVKLAVRSIYGVEPSRNNFSLWSIITGYHNMVGYSGSRQAESMWYADIHSSFKNLWPEISK